MKVFGELCPLFLYRVRIYIRKYVRGGFSRGGDEMKQYTMGDVTELAEECISLGKEARPELSWLKSRYEIGRASCRERV